MPISDQGRRCAVARPLLEGDALGDVRRPDLAAALKQLDRATREFARRLATTDGAPAERASGGGQPLLRDDAFEPRMREAEREARAYLEQAKRRADSLVAAMVGAVEQEAAQIRREAQEDARRRRREAEADAEAYLSDAQRVAESMVAERQQRIAVLTDSVCSRAEALTAGMDDAEKVRRQFESFVRGLSQTADRIAAGSAAAATPMPPRLRGRAHPPHDDALAA